MSGHSKWSTIKRKKGEKDGARAKVFTKISREIIVAIKEGGGDPNNNAKLATLIQKAKSNNIPNDNIDRLIKKAVGGGEKNDYENCVYEGYGPNGVAVIVDCLTDNRNRTAGEIRHYFDKFGGNMGTSGCVSFMFNLKGIIVLDNEEGTIDEDKAMEDILEAGGDDLREKVRLSLRDRQNANYLNAFLMLSSLKEHYTTPYIFCGDATVHEIQHGYLIRYKNMLKYYLPDSKLPACTLINPDQYKAAFLEELSTYAASGEVCMSIHSARMI